MKSRSERVVSAIAAAEVTTSRKGPTPDDTTRAAGSSSLVPTCLSCTVSCVGDSDFEQDAENAGRGTIEYVGIGPSSTTSGLSNSAPSRGCHRETVLALTRSSRAISPESARIGVPMIAPRWDFRLYSAFKRPRLLERDLLRLSRRDIRTAAGSD